MINLHESMRPGLDQTCDPWICSQTCYRLHYVARYNEILINPYKLAINFMGYQQIMQNQIRHHRLCRLIRFCTVCLQNVLLKFNEIVNYNTKTLKFKMDLSNLHGWDIPLGRNRFQAKGSAYNINKLIQKIKANNKPFLGVARHCTLDFLFISDNHST